VEYTFLLRAYRALSGEYRALLTECRALLIEYRAIFRANSLDANGGIQRFFPLFYKYVLPHLC